MGRANGADPGNCFPGHGSRGGSAGAGCCTASGAGFVSVAQALRAGRALANYLNHRQGWDLQLLSDGSTRATSPDGQTILRSHGPPPTTQTTG
jgi:hypothetical protein